MYITETTDNVRKLIEEVEQKEDLNKLKYLIYIFGLLNNKQINDKNEANPDLIDDDIKILSLELLGMESNVNTVFLQYLVMLYNTITKTNDAYGNVLGIEYDNEDKEILSKCERLSFNEKLDVISEIIIRYDLEKYFKERVTMLTFDSTTNGFEIAKRIKDFKNND